MFKLRSLILLYFLIKKDQLSTMCLVHEQAIVCFGFFLKLEKNKLKADLLSLGVPMKRMTIHSSLSYFLFVCLLPQ